MSDKIQQLKEKFDSQEDLEQINVWEHKLREQMVITDLYKNEAIKMLLEQLQVKIDDVNSQLQNNQDLTDRDRDKLFVEKRCWSWFQSFFDVSNNIVKSIEQEINDALK